MNKPSLELDSLPSAKDRERRLEINRVVEDSNNPIHHLKLG